MTKAPAYLDLAHCSAVPCREFLFGTDTMGRDIFSMIWYGGRLSLFIGVGSTVISTLRASEYVIAAKCMGGSFFHILRCHLAPNFFSSILFPPVPKARRAISADSTRPLRGLRLPLEGGTWGSMLSLAEKALMTDAWWILLIPGAFLVVTLLCITTLGDYLRSRTSRKESNL